MIRRKQIPSCVFFVSVRWPSQFRERQEIEEGSEDSSPALLFMELKGCGMTGITNSTNHAAHLLCACIRSSSADFTRAELDWDHCLKNASPTLRGLTGMLSKPRDLPICHALTQRLFVSCPYCQMEHPALHVSVNVKKKVLLKMNKATRVVFDSLFVCLYWFSASSRCWDSRAVRAGGVCWESIWGAHFSWTETH